MKNTNKLVFKNKEKKYKKHFKKVQKHQIFKPNSIIFHNFVHIYKKKW